MKKSDKDALHQVLLLTDSRVKWRLAPPPLDVSWGGGRVLWVWLDILASPIRLKLHSLLLAGKKKKKKKT